LSRPGGRSYVGWVFILMPIVADWRPFLRWLGVHFDTICRGLGAAPTLAGCSFWRHLSRPGGRSYETLAYC